MGLIHVTVELKAQKDGPAYEALFLVDTGASTAWPPPKNYSESASRRRGRDSYELADVEPVEFDFGIVEIRSWGT